MADLLFEIGTEELPPGLIINLTEQIKTNILNSLKEQDINVDQKNIEIYSTPRRIALILKSLPEKQELKEIEVKGPDKLKAFDKAGNPAPSAIGFAKKYNLEPKDLITKEVNGTEYLFVKTKTGGNKTSSLLKNILPSSLRNTTGDKFMKWGNYEEKFVRPVRWITALLDNEIISFSYAGINSSDTTFGHRFFENNSPIKITNLNDYEKKLFDYKIIASRDKRKIQVREELERLAKETNTEPIIDEKLVDEVTNITENPKGIVCKFDEEYLLLPECVIETVLRKHQKYFVLKDKNTKKLTNKFIVITNGIGKEENIKRGNEKVVRARLNDAKFFCEEDLKRPFTYEERIKDLSKITFQKGLGTMEEKVERLTRFSEYIYEGLKEKSTCKREEIINTAKLCKLDLTTGMVFEMPELQGEVGSIYARRNGTAEIVSQGIREHYLNLPKSLIGSIVGIADKLDNICCLFSIGKIPSGSTDPFALRRQGQSIIETIITNNLNIDLSDLIKYHKEKVSEEKIILVRNFLLDRLTYSLTNRGFKNDIINAVCSTGDPLSNITETITKIETLENHYEKNKDKFNPFLIAAKRLVRIVDSNSNGNLDISKLTIAQEKELLNNIDKVAKAEYKSYNDFLNNLSELTTPINSFFDKVLVNDPNPEIKKARQALLKKGKMLFEKICDFNQILERN